MKTFDVVLGLLIGLLPILAVLLFIVHPLLGLVVSAALVAFYGAIMDSIVQRVTRREREREIELGERSVDAFLGEVKNRYGVEMYEHISKQKWSIPQAMEFLREHEEYKRRLAKSINERKVA